MKRSVYLAMCVSILWAAPADADVPATMYIFPAGAQRGTSVRVRVGGLYLHEACAWEMAGPGVSVPPRIEAVETIWFEGPVIPLPDSQQAEDYPRDLAATVSVAANAPLGNHPWRVWTDQGAVPSRSFLVGTLPEVVEDEIDGAPLPVEVKLPVTINGRIFPREDVDLWTFSARAGQVLTCTALTNRLGSPFDARLEIRDARGHRVAESTENSLPGIDSFVRFTAPVDGDYSVVIHDVKYGGLQHYVYRLTVTAEPFVDRIYPLGGRRGTRVPFELTGGGLSQNRIEWLLPTDLGSTSVTDVGLSSATGRLISVELDDLPEALETEPNDRSDQAREMDVPFVGNGQIGRPGDVDYWRVRGVKGQTLEFDLRAARLGSPLDSVITLLDLQGQELARADDVHLTDSFLRYTFPADGQFLVKVEERLPTRGAPAFAYRLRVAPPPAPDFSVQLPADAISVARGGESKIKFKVVRNGSFAEPVTLQWSNLPAGVAVSEAVVPGNADEVEVSFKATAMAPVDAHLVTVRGTAMIAGQPLIRLAKYVSTNRDDITNDTLLLAVTQPTPFKISGVYEVKYAQRGGKFVRHFKIERGGYTGPLQVRLADKQARHLQGVRGPAIEVPADATEFDYPIYLPPWMEIGRTSRTVVMGIGEVVDPDGHKHKVSFTSLAQNEQIVALVDPGQLSLDVDRQSVVAIPGENAELTIRIGRGQGVNVPVRVELVTANHIRGISAEPVVLPQDQSVGSIRLQFANGRIGPFNMPVTLRATALKGKDDPVVAEAQVELVPDR
ncbi:MAG: PPC domain-containing protein [Planctomycetes bacterium]|nr:PPC domain-containing protein [Planctomycetota bacterium]